MMSKSVKLIKDKLQVLINIVNLIRQHNKYYIWFSVINSILLGLLPSAMTLTMKHLIDLLQDNNPSVNIYRVLVLYLFLMIISILSSYIFQLYELKFRQSFNLEVKKTILHKLSVLNLRDLEDSETYDWVIRAQSGGEDKLIDFFESFLQSFQTLINVIAFFFILIEFNIYIAFLNLLLPSFKYFITRNYNNKVYEIMHNRVAKDREIAYLENILTEESCHKELKVYNLHEFLINRYERIKKRFITQDIMTRKNYLVKTSIVDLFIFFINAVIILVLLQKCLEKSITIGDFIIFSNIVVSSHERVFPLFFHIAEMEKQRLFIEQYFIFMNKRIFSQKGLKIKDIKTIEFINVSFKYKNTDNYALKNINFKIDKGKKMAIVGKNGSGKTTLVKLIAGLYDDYEGTILINSINLSEIDRVSYFEKIGAVFQDYIKYETTLRENIAYGDVDRLFDEKLLSKTTKQFGLNKVFLKDSEGFDMQLGYMFNQGRQISGGEWQKIAIARAFFKDANVYILDEPNSTLDPISELEFCEMYKYILGNKIGIVTAHRMVNLVKIVDSVIILEKGQIIDKGNHEDLMKRCSTYREMFLIEHEKIRVEMY